jgi:hypothetical protein
MENWHDMARLSRVLARFTMVHYTQKMAQITGNFSYLGVLWSTVRKQKNYLGSCRSTIELRPQYQRLKSLLLVYLARFWHGIHRCKNSDTSLNGDPQ